MEAPLFSRAGDTIIWCFYPPYHASHVAWMQCLHLTRRYILLRRFIYIYFFNFISMKKTKLTIIHIVFNAKTTIKNPKSSCLVVITVQPKIKKNLWKQVIFCLYFKGIIVFRLFIFARKNWPNQPWQLNPYKKTISPIKQRQFFCEWRGKIVISTIIWIYVTVKIPGSEVFV